LPAGPFTYGDLPFQVSATSDAGLPVAFKGEGACTAQGTTVTIAGAGQCDVTASQAGDVNHNPAADVLKSTIIAKATATINFDAGTLAQIYNGALKTVATTTAPAFLPVKLSFTGTPQNAGSYPVTATIDDLKYQGTASDTLVLGKASSTVTVSCPLVDQTYTGAAIAPCTAAATGVGLVSPVDVSASLLYTANISAGPAGASASWDGDTNHTGNTGSGGFTIGEAASKTTFGTSPTPTAGANFTVNASNNSAGAIAYSWVSGPCALVSGATFSSSGAGTCVVRADSAATSNYLASSAQQNVTIAQPPPSGISINPNPNRSDRLGAEVEFQVLVTGAGLGGSFSATGLPNGIRIDGEGEIYGHVGGPVGTRTVTVSFTKDGRRHRLDDILVDGHAAGARQGPGPGPGPGQGR
jgi:hypothetical protein